MNARLRFWLPLILIILVWSCKDDDTKPVNKSLLSSQSILTRPAGELQTLLGLSGLNLPIASLKYDVEIYKITYKTTYLNNDITASGLVILPKTSGSYPMVSFQHGTIAAHSQAPSVQPLSSTELILYAALASPGFITAIPDFIGFGNSGNVMHPYYVEDVTATTVIDCLKAANELAREKGIQFNKKLFLAGYSQGGYATMATHKAIEANGLDGFQLVASFPASGGYDVKGMQEYLFEQDTYDEPFFLGYVAMAYKASYQWTQPLTDIFNEPYATRIPALYDGSKTGGEIDAQLTTSIKELITSSLIIGIDSEARFAYLKDAFNENSLTDWKPSKPIFMYHGDADVTIPYSNSLATYNVLVANNSSADVVTLTTLSGANHESGVIPYIEDFIPKMLDLR
jgi:pimeloyl-ACP methyl ester carboxylesterase